jgi:hypothetical protein
MKVIFIIITFITFCLFFMEALIHFNIGKNTITKPDEHKYITIYKGLVIHIPDKIEFVKIFLTVLLFSSISGIISAYIIKYHYI